MYILIYYIPLTRHISYFNSEETQYSQIHYWYLYYNIQISIILNYLLLIETPELCAVTSIDFFFLVEWLSANRFLFSILIIMKQSIIIYYFFFADYYLLCSVSSTIKWTTTWSLMNSTSILGNSIVMFWYLQFHIAKITVKLKKTF